MSSSLWRSVFSRRTLLCATTGFASGMPLYVLFQLLPAWLRDSGVDLKTIGLMSLVSFPYTWKFLWSPLMDRVHIPGFGRRRGWALLTQSGLVLSLAALSLVDPIDSIGAVMGIAAIIAAFSASQDIVLDAYRRELLPDEELGFGNSVFVNAYRLSSLVPGSLALVLADRYPWSTVHLVVAGFMGLALLSSLFMPEPTVPKAPVSTLRESVVLPFSEFFGRNGVKQALLILTFMLLYKLGDSMATALSTPFYLDLGFTKTQIASIVKVASLGSTVGGGFLGGLLMLRVGIYRALWLFGGVQIASILGFAALAQIGANPTALFLVVSFEYLGVGLGTAAFVAFIARSTHKAHTATQFALLTSLAGLPRTLANASTGYLVEAFGYTSFFLICTALALPGLLMLPWVAPWGDTPKHN